MVAPYVTVDVPTAAWRIFPGQYAGLGPTDRAKIGVVFPFRSKSSTAAGPTESTRYGLPAESVALKAAGQGDEQAFAQFYDLVAPLAFSVVLNIVRNRAMAEEVLQEVFVEIWRLAPRFDPAVGSAKSWTTTIARRRAIDRVRSEEAARRREDRDAELRPIPADTVSEAIVDGAERSVLLGAFKELSGPQQEALQLAYFGGHTYRTVAEMLDVPEGTIKTRIRDGLIRLRQIMEAEA